MSEEIQDKLAYVVIDEVTMQQVSKFYSRKGDATKFIKKNKRYYVEEGVRLAIAEFEYKRYYVID